MNKNSADLKSQSKNWSHKRSRPSKKSDNRDVVKWYKQHDDLIVYLQTILEDALTILSSYGRADCAKDIRTLKNRVRDEGISFATKSLPNLSDRYLTYLETGKSDYPGFKIQSGTEYPVFLRGLFKLMYDSPNDVQGIQALSVFYQLCVTFKKIKGPYPPSVLGKQLAEFVSVDDSLSKIDFESEALLPIIEHAGAIITNIFRDFDPYDDNHARPKPGPGATNTKVEKHMRYEPHVLYTQHHDVLDYFEWFYANPWHLVNEARSVLSLWENRRVAPRARQLFVHKKVGKARGICIEENESQFLQQAFKRSLYNFIERNPITRGRINFTSQEINQELALSSSSDLSLGTIDMSEASDRVAFSLVLLLFKGLPELKAILAALSTRFVDFSKTQCDIGIDSIEMYKYAPMGSGLCFPIMALVHFALIQAIIRMSAVPNRYALSKKVYVYGDDIIIPVECVPAVYAWLPMFGMKLNINKSFYVSPFRESCGVHAYNGVDITPVYFQSIITKHSRTDSLLSAISKEYLFHKRGYVRTAELIRKEANRRFGTLPFVGRTSPILGFKRDGRTDLESYLNFSNPKVRRKRIRSSSSRTLLGSDCSAGKMAARYDENQLEYRCRVVEPMLMDLPPLGGERAYFRKQLVDARDAADVKGSCERVTLRYKWVPESAI